MSEDEFTFSEIAAYWIADSLSCAFGCLIAIGVARMFGIIH